MKTEAHVGVKIEGSNQRVEGSGSVLLLIYGLLWRLQHLSHRIGAVLADSKGASPGK